MPQDQDQDRDVAGEATGDPEPTRQDEARSEAAEGQGGDRLGPAGEAALRKERDENAKLRKRLRDLERADEDRRAQEEEERNRTLPEIEQLRRRATDASSQAEQHRREAERLQGELLRTRRENAIFQAAAPLAVSPEIICKILSDSEDITHDPDAPPNRQFRGVKEAVEKLLKSHPELSRQGSHPGGALPRDPRQAPPGRPGGGAGGTAASRENIADQMAQYGLANY